LVDEQIGESMNDEPALDIDRQPGVDLEILENSIF
jgi:hypothetical protein